MQTYAPGRWAILGRQLKTLRRTAGYRESLHWSNAVGLSGRTVLGLERGEPRSDDTLERIAVVLRLPVEAMYDVLSGKTDTLPDVPHAADDLPAVRPVVGVKTSHGDLGILMAAWDDMDEDGRTRVLRAALDAYFDVKRGQ